MAGGGGARRQVVTCSAARAGVVPPAAHHRLLRPTVSRTAGTTTQLPTAGTWARWQVRDRSCTPRLLTRRGNASPTRAGRRGFNARRAHARITDEDTMTTDDDKQCLFFDAQGRGPSAAGIPVTPEVGK